MNKIQFKERILGDTKKEIICNIINRFVKEGYNDTNLLWNCFITKSQLISFEDVKKLCIPNSDNLFFYMERQNEIYIVNFDNICNFIDNMQPWDEIDAYIFDLSFTWIIAITHEDNLSLVIGLES